VVTPSPELAVLTARTIQNEFVDHWREASRVSTIAADNVRISVDGRVIRITGEMDWEPLLVLTAGTGPFH
jgi:hypothetical protein